MEELENKIIKFVKERNWDQLDYPDSLIKSIVIEASELLECIQWDSNLNIDNVSDELADVLIYCFQLAYSLNLDIKTIIENKLEKMRLNIQNNL
ncbi:MAG TPA: nucleotide pyrophosphohydrolase [Candidatus Erysipelatoclostridium merdavium]|uniref:Nucleotide pyrophosphohydrolase n=1 Tax=Candidatus Erysipelatoclostridium merdavium TaxID=2838566 RepID=A0A9D2BLK3_9FIRM|nr:nucleotide pyrophosphohydrolase [Candidatus Erysipelatoclostridium merdavium]